VPGFASWLVAAWCDRPQDEAEDLTEKLVDAQLVEPAGADESGQLRYRMHDLIRVLATERAPDPPSGALRRWLESALALTVHAASRIGDDVRGVRDAAAATAHPRAAEAVDRDALGWLSAERAGLVVAVQRALDAGQVRPAWQLAHALAGFFEVRAAWDDWEQTHEAALAAAVDAGDRAGEAAIRSGLGRLDLDRGRFDAALANLRAAAAIAHDLDLEPLLAQTLHRLGQGLQHVGDHAAATDAYQRSLSLARTLGDTVVQCECLRGLSWAADREGRPDLTAARLEEALAVLGDRSLPLQTPWLLIDLARADRELGRTDRAAELLRRAIAVAESFGDHRAAVHALYALGEVLRQNGELDTAHELLSQALTLARDLHDDHAELLTLRRLGLTLDALGRTAEAEQALADVVAKAAATGRHAMRGVTLRDLATARARNGRPHAAEALRECIAVFRSLGMDDFREQAEQQLAQLPDTVRLEQP
jgi:tetratricopeptide (TPR) repeat protein